MAEIFNSPLVKKEFEKFYQEIIPNLNDCNNCGITQCLFCNKFKWTCCMCRSDSCKNCIAHKNSVDLFYEKCNQEEWNYICNILYDFFSVSWISRWYFKDISKVITSSIDKTVFMVAYSEQFPSKKFCRGIYYMLGDGKYEF